MPCLSAVFVYLQRPLGIAIIIVFASFIISVFIYLNIARAWFSFLLFIVFLRGMIIIFIYVSSLASNEVSFSNISVLLRPGILFIFLFITLDRIFFKNRFLLNLKFSRDSLFCLKIYRPFIFILSMVMIVYLLVALIVVVKISLFTEGPLRAKN